MQAELAAQSALGEPVRALLDLKPAKAATKRWGWVKKGAPVIVEVGGRDVAGGNVSVVRRDRLYREDGKLDSAVVAKGDFAARDRRAAGGHPDRAARRRRPSGCAPTSRPSPTGPGSRRCSTGKAKNPGWADVAWSKPTGAALDQVVERLKALKLTLRNAPMDQRAAEGACIFTGEPAVERVLVGRAY